MNQDRVPRWDMNTLINNAFKETEKVLIICHIVTQHFKVCFLHSASVKRYGIPWLVGGTAETYARICVSPLVLSQRAFLFLIVYLV
jgi:hypothetical protein